MFADFSPDSEWSNHSRRGWTTLISFTLQALAVGCLLLLPLFYTEGLPRLAMLAPLLAPAPPPAAPPPRPNAPAARQRNLMGDRLNRAALLPPPGTMLTEITLPPPMVDPSAAGIRHGIGDPNGRGTVVDS